MQIGCPATGGHGEAAAGVCVYVYGPYYEQRQGSNPWSLLPPGTMLMFKDCMELDSLTATLGRADPTPSLPWHGFRRHVDTLLCPHHLWQVGELALRS